MAKGRPWATEGPLSTSAVLGGTVALDYESLCVISQVAALCFSQFISAMPFFLIARLKKCCWHPRFRMFPNKNYVSKDIWTSSFLPWICIARTWWTADEALGGAGSGHPLESVLAYLKADIVSNTKCWLEDAICHSWEQIFIVEAPVLFALDCLLMCR